MLRVAGLSKAFGAVRVLHEVELDAATGMITGIIGPNGAGKSTLLYVIGGLLKPDTGRIILEGADITAVVPYKRALRGLVRTFQIARTPSWSASGSGGWPTSPRAGFPADRRSCSSSAAR